MSFWDTVFGAGDSAAGNAAGGGGGFSWGSALAYGIPAIFSAWSSAQEGDANREAADDRWRQERELTLSRDAAARQQAMDMARLQAALDKGSGAAVQSAQIRANADMEIARRENLAKAYQAMMQAAIQGGDNHAKTLMDAINSTQTWSRNPYGGR
jgi:hypothetical protein